MITRGTAVLPAFVTDTPRRFRIRTGEWARPTCGRPAPIVGQELFAGALKRERNRTHRFGDSFMLLLVCMKENGVEDSPLPEPVVNGLLAATRDSDIVGWITPGSAIGIILTACASEAAVLRSFEARVRQQLAGSVGDEIASRVAIRREFYTAAHAARLDSAVPPAEDSLVEALCGESLDHGFHDALKRALDVAVSAGLLVVLSPLLVAIALLVKLTSRGPVLFRQVRIGHHARPFTMLKFRTMRVGADHAVHRQFVTDFITKSGQGGQPKDEQIFKLVNDSRVTPIGRFLRKTSLDELPQLWNVLRGDMSLVGPRPPLDYEVAKYEPWHWRRVLDAKPGVTGLWQVTGRSRTTFDGMVRLDLRYAKTQSVWTDLRILLATPKAVVVGKGAC